MELIAKLIELALVEVCDRGMIDWIPGDGEPEAFEAECEIVFNRYRVGSIDVGYWGGDYYVTMLGVFVIVDSEDLVAWHSSRVHNPVICAEKPCDYCLA